MKIIKTMIVNFCIIASFYMAGLVMASLSAWWKHLVFIGAITIGMMALELKRGN